MEPLLLGVDVGTSAVKAALFDLNGRLEASAQVEYPTHHLRPGWVEQQPDDWWRACCQAVRQALAAVAHGAERVVGVGVSAQAPTLIAVDRDGVPLRPALIWMDRRAEAEVQALCEQVGADEIYRITGNRPDPYYLAAKLLWFGKHEPRLMARTAQFLQITGFINHRLTGAFAVDHVHAALLQLREHDTGRWSGVICDACGLDPAQLPPVRLGHEVVGEVTAQAAEVTGLRPGTPVMAGTVDGAAAALEAGVAQAGIAAEMTGTSTVVMIPNSDGITEPSLISMPHAIPPVHLLVGAMVSSGASLKWYRDQFGLVEQQAAHLLHADVYDLLTRQAAQAPPGSDGLIFLPYMMGERSPLWHTQARGVLFGLSLATTRAATIRAILEGTAFALRHNLEVASQAGAPVREVRSVGGGARSALWNQIKADVLGLPILLPEASVGAPFGDAMLVAMGLGYYPDLMSTLTRIVQIKTVYEPRSECRGLYDELYGIFRDLYVHLRGDFDRVARWRAANDAIHPA